MRLSGAIDRYLAAAGISDATRRAYRADLNDFAEWFGDRPLDEIDVRTLSEYTAYLGRARQGGKLSASTISRRLAAVRGLVRHALGPERVPDVPLSPKRVGAHDPAYIAAPDVAFLERLLALGPVTHVTVAPEEPGGLDLVSLLAGGGVTVAIGHSDADAATANAAFDRGARVVTHLYNAQRPFSARDPGIIGAALTRDDVTVSLILDGVHVAREAVLLAWRAAPGRFAIVTDAIEAAGRPDEIGRAHV